MSVFFPTLRFWKSSVRCVQSVRGRRAGGQFGRWGRTGR